MRSDEPEHILNVLSRLQASYTTKQTNQNNLLNIWADCRTHLPERLYQLLIPYDLNAKNGTITIRATDPIALCEALFFRQRILEFFQERDPSVKKIRLIV